MQRKSYKIEIYIQKIKNIEFFIELNLFYFYNYIRNNFLVLYIINFNNNKITIKKNKVLFRI